MSDTTLRHGDGAGSGLILRPGAHDIILLPRMKFRAVCLGPDGEVRWEDEGENLVTNVGLTFNLETMLRGSSYTAAWYLVLKNAGSIANADTLASHAGWTEQTPYAGNRPAVTFPAVSGGAVTSNQINISINATATVAGAGIATVNTGTSGTLYNMADFAASRSVASGDTLNVTCSYSATL